MKIAILGLASAVLLIEESSRKRTGALWRRVTQLTERQLTD